MINIRIARAFRGPRHDRVSLIWDVIAEWARDKVRLIVFDNTGPDRLSHGDVFNAMWEAERGLDERYVLFTEMDFLPALARKWLPLEALSRNDAIGVEYKTRHPDTMALRSPRGPVPGGWWVLIDKWKAPTHIEFNGVPDPGNQLHKQLGMEIYSGVDCFPIHYGIRYPVGEHLFWSRHWHDNPDDVVAGVRLGDMQAKVDRAIDLWIEKQPEDFRQLLEKRSGLPA